MIMDSDQPPQLHGVVIITLPPSDNPSSGKTITAYTLTDSDFHFPQSQQQPNLLQPSSSSSSINPQAHFTHRRLFFFGNPRKIVGGFCSMSLFALLIYATLSPNTVQDPRDSNEDDNNPTSFIFPLFFKNATIVDNLKRDLELRLRRFNDLEKENMAGLLNEEIMTHKVKHLVSSISVSAASSSTILPVRGNVFPNGLYFTYVLIGMPPRPYFLDIDSGSDLTWIQCDAPCTSCAKGANALYKPGKGNLLAYKDALCLNVQQSGNGKKYCETCQQCDYVVEYADHSSSMGVLTKDEVHLLVANGSSSKLDVVFGCAYDQQGLLLTTLSKTDGVLGLSKAKVSLPSQFASRGIINNVVGHCLTIDAGGGGYLFLGDDFVPQWGMAWVPMLASHRTDVYETEILKLHYGNSRLGLGVQDSRVARVVFDSGSSYTYFTKQAYSELVASLIDLSSLGFTVDTSDLTLPVCWHVNFLVREISDVSRFFKTISLQFGSKWWIISKKFRLPPEGYLIISDKGNVCLGILDGSEALDASTLILGDISLRGKLVVFDNVSQRIGWATSNCIKPTATLHSLPSFEV